MPAPPALEPLIADSVGYLSSPAARESLARDPYWPKWDSPWWHMTLLWELGLAERIPASALAAMAAAIGARYLDFFPLSDEEVPPGKDESLHVLCHCALGTMDQVLLSRGLDLRASVGWTADWYRRYQLPDGGLNCEKAAYRGSRKSSIVSTLPCLEAVLARAERLSAEDARFLEGGARYLIEHRLVRSRAGKVIDPRWLEPCFPRFYEYDALRGARFLQKWAALTGKRLPPGTLDDARPWLEGGPVHGRRDALTRVSLVWDGGRWSRGAAIRFPLLDAVSGSRHTARPSG